MLNLFELRVFYIFSSMLPYCTNSCNVKFIKYTFKVINKINFHSFKPLTNKNESGSDKCKRSSTVKKSDIDGSSIKYKFHSECEEGLNRQINKEFFASYTYSSMAIYFDRHDIALKGFSKFFRMAADEEIVHARQFMQYQTMRGGHVVLRQIAAPEQHDWDTPSNAIIKSIELEKSVIKSLEALHSTASQHKDISLIDYIESQYIQEQYRTLKQLGDLHTNVTRAGSKYGLLILDHDLREYLKSHDDWKMYNIKEL